MATSERGMISLIAANVDAEGAEADSIAESAFHQAVDSIGKEDGVPWNKIAKTATLTASTGAYEVDSLLNVDDVRGVLRIYMTDEENWEVERRELADFNLIRRGNTTEGKVYIFSQYTNSDGKLTVEFFYTPDAAYNLWVLYRVPLTFNMIPDEWKDIVLWKAIMIANGAGNRYYDKGLMLYTEAMNKLKGESYQKWHGTHLRPDFVFGRSGIRRTKVDSGKFWSGLG